MSKRTPLTDAEVEDALASLPGWSFEQDRLRKTYTFKNFREAVSFIVRMAFYAEELDHHPELHNVYNRVTVSLSTHDAGNKVTGMDVSLARAIEDFSWR